MVTKEESLTLSNNHPVIALSEKLLKGLREVAVLRAKHGNRVPVDESSEITENHFIGLCGEAAVAGYYSLPLNLTYYHPIDPGYDFIAQYIPKNKRIKIDVKTSTNLNGDLLVSKKNMNNNADIYILCLKYDSKIVIKGTASNKIIKNAKTVKIDNDSVYKISQNVLHNIPEQDDISNVQLDMEGLSSVDVDKEDLIEVKNN